MRTTTCSVLAAVMMANVAAAAPPAGKCEIEKLEIAGTYAQCRLYAYAKARRTGAAPDYAACDARYSNRWSSLEADFSCVAFGDRELVRGEARAFASQVVGVVGGPHNPRFVDTGDGTITDMATELEWEKKITLDGVPNPADPHDADNVYPWAGNCSISSSKFCQPTAAAAGACVASVGSSNPHYCQQCSGSEGTCSESTTVWTWLLDVNASNFAGHNDWRLPERADLQSLMVYNGVFSPHLNPVFYSLGCGAACTDITDPDCSCTFICGNCSDFGYWSASTLTNFDSRAWGIDFGLGSIDPVYKAQQQYVRAVRGGP